jgi:hypothetical protein
VGEFRLNAQLFGVATQPATFGVTAVRLWSLHPKYLDSKGLVALWREAPRTRLDRVVRSSRACLARSAAVSGVSYRFSRAEPGSPDAEDAHPVAVNKLRRALHRLASANSVMTCAPFLASPR